MKRKTYIIKPDGLLGLMLRLAGPVLAWPDLR